MESNSHSLESCRIRISQTLPILLPPTYPAYFTAALIKLYQHLHLNKIRERMFSVNQPCCNYRCTLVTKRCLFYQDQQIKMKTGPIENKPEAKPFREG